MSDAQLFATALANECFAINVMDFFIVMHQRFFGHINLKLLEVFVSVTLQEGEFVVDRSALCEFGVAEKIEELVEGTDYRDNRYTREAFKKCLGSANSDFLELESILELYRGYVDTLLTATSKELDRRFDRSSPPQPNFDVVQRGIDAQNALNQIMRERMQQKAEDWKAWDREFRRTRDLKRERSEGREFNSRDLYKEVEKPPFEKKKD